MRKRFIPEIGKWVEVDEIYRDPNSGLNGPVYCPEGGYYDMCLDKKFKSKEEKRTYMREKGLMNENKYHPVDKRRVYYSYPGQKTMSRGYKDR